MCTKCSGTLRGINPPHRIKSISMSSFTSEEVELVRARGNAWCAAVWLGNYNKAANPVDFKDEEKIKEFIVAKVKKSISSRYEWFICAVREETVLRGAGPG